MKSFFQGIKRVFSSPWFAAVVVALIISFFAVWYGAWWSLFVVLPLIYDYYIGHHIRTWHERMYKQYAWWRVVWAIWCAFVFAVVVGVIAHMLLFKWTTPFFVTFAVVMVYGIWEEMRSHSKVYVWLYSWVFDTLCNGCCVTYTVLLVPDVRYPNRVYGEYAYGGRLYLGK